MELEWAQRDRLIPSPDKQWTRVSGEEVLKRNRYSNIDPFLNNRVKLHVPKGYDDYINASPILLPCTKKDAKKKYIATQARRSCENIAVHMLTSLDRVRPKVLQDTCGVWFGMKRTM